MNCENRRFPLKFYLNRSENDSQTQELQLFKMSLKTCLEVYVWTNNLACPSDEVYDTSMSLIRLGTLSNGRVDFDSKAVNTIR